MLKPPSVDTQTRQSREGPPPLDATPRIPPRPPELRPSRTAPSSWVLPPGNRPPAVLDAIGPCPAFGRSHARTFPVGLPGPARRDRTAYRRSLHRPYPPPSSLSPPDGVFLSRRSDIDRQL